MSNLSINIQQVMDKPSISAEQGISNLSVSVHVCDCLASLSNLGVSVQLVISDLSMTVRQVTSYLSISVQQVREVCGDVPGGEKLETVAAARVHLITAHLVHRPAVQHASNVEVQQRDQTPAHHEYPGVQQERWKQCFALWFQCWPISDMHRNVALNSQSLINRDNSTRFSISGILPFQLNYLGIYCRIDGVSKIYKTFLGVLCPVGSDSPGFGPMRL
jgi:hypothetical protein